MEEKKTVVIQGRTIEKERPSERARYSYPSGYNYNSHTDVSDKSSGLENQGLSSAYSLSTLREGRNPSQSLKTLKDLSRLEPRTRLRSSSYSASAGRTSASRVTGTGPRPRRRIIEEETSQHNSLMIKIGVSVVLALIIFLLNSIPLPFTQGLVDHVKTALTEDFDVDEALGKLKFVGDAIPEQIKSVFQQNTQGLGRNDKQQNSNTDSNGFTAPVKGEVVRSFGEQIVLQDTGKVYANQGIDIKTAENAGVYASADGFVAAIEEHESYGPSIWLEHGNKVFTFYGRCSDVDVKLGQKVNKGQKLGTVQSPNEGDPNIHFQIWIDDKPVDPLKRISQAGQASEGQGV